MRLGLHKVLRVLKVFSFSRTSTCEKEPIGQSVTSELPICVLNHCPLLNVPISASLVTLNQQ